MKDKFRHKLNKGFTCPGGIKCRYCGTLSKDRKTYNRIARARLKHDLKKDVNDD